LFNVINPIGKHLEAPGVLGDEKITLIQITVLPVELHVLGAAIGEEVVVETALELIRGGVFLHGKQVQQRVGDRIVDP
jgi:hypothetical protein